jgi:Uma2 family endonuclease
LVTHAASVAHQRIGSFLEVLMRLFCETHKIGEVFRSSIPVKVSIFRGREPDLFYINKENSHIIRPTFIDGAPDLAIEIVSPESVVRDTEDRFDEYESAGIKEYWLIFPDEQKVKFFGLSSRTKLFLCSESRL